MGSYKNKTADDKLPADKNFNILAFLYLRVIEKSYFKVTH
jgi:hypothetical protein